MSELKKLIKEKEKFRLERDWKKFHNPKDSAISLCLEAAELLEHFQWKTNSEVEEYLKKHKIEVAEELADVLHWILLMSYDLNIDIVKIAREKMKKDAKKYPINKAKGKCCKYNQL